MRVVFRCDPNLVDHLQPPQSARAVLPEWLRQMPSAAFSETHGADIRTVKQCPPFVDAMTHGFVFTLPCDVSVSEGVFSWDWPLPEPASHMHPRAPLSFHAPAQVTGSPFHSADRVIVKFNSFWTVELPEGWSLFAMPPANRSDLPFRALCGLVDADRYHDVGILFPAVWTDPEFEGVLPRGMPLVQCFPVARTPLDYSVEVFDDEQTNAYDALGQQLLDDPGIYRKQYRAPRSRAPREHASQGGGFEPETSGRGRG